MKEIERALSFADIAFEIGEYTEKPVCCIQNARCAHDTVLPGVPMDDEQAEELDAAIGKLKNDFRKLGEDV